jgi:hypothetical protein
VIDPPHRPAAVLRGPAKPDLAALAPRAFRLAVWCCALVACRGSKPHRTSDQPPVQVVTQPQLADGGAGSGSAVDEVEPNDGIDTATPLPLGATMRGKIDSEGDVDRFRLDIDTPGVLALAVGGAEGETLVLELDDASGDPLAVSSRGMPRVKEGIPNFGVTAGRYFVTVRAAPKRKPKPARGHHPPDAPPGPPPVYELTAQLVQPAAGFEREPNDDRGTANDVIQGDTVNGYVGWNGDNDVWKLSVEAMAATTAIDVEVSAVEGVALELVVADGIGTALATRKAPRGAPVLVRGLVPVVPQGGSPFHYLTVRGTSSNPETAYHLRVTAHPLGPDAEVEPNDSPDKPYAIPADRTVVHATWTPGDVDCFAATPPATQSAMSATVEQQGALDLGIEMWVDGKSIGKVEHAKGSAGHIGGVVTPGARVVFCVHGSASATAEGTYDLSVRDEP